MDAAKSIKVFAKFAVVLALVAACSFSFAVLAQEAPTEPGTPTIVGSSQEAAQDAGLLTGVSKSCFNPNAGPNEPQGDCSLCDIITVFNNIILGIQGIIGSLALAAFVYAGFLILTSFGGEKIEQGKEIMKNAAIGIALVFFSVVIVNFGLNIIVSGGNVERLGGAAQIFGRSWLSICAEANP